MFEKTRILDVGWKFILRRVEREPEGNLGTVATGNLQEQTEGEWGGGKIVPVSALKTYTRSRIAVPLILNLRSKLNSPIGIRIPDRVSHSLAANRLRYPGTQRDPVNYKMPYVQVPERMAIQCSKSTGTRLKVKHFNTLQQDSTSHGMMQRVFALSFRHRASCILGQAFPYSPENAFYIFNQQIYLII